MKLGFVYMAALVAGAVNALEPCAQVTDTFHESRKSDSTFLISGELVYRCLQSIPIRVPEAVSFIDEYRKFLPFQSTLDNLKDPPSDYAGPRVDLMGGLDKIQKKAKQNKYSSQFEFDLALLELISSAHDDHLQIEPCSTTIFSFTHGEPLVSISQDGLKLPEVYTLGDAELLAQGKPASPVKSINGTNSSGYLERFSSNQAKHDPDARYNTLFPSLSRDTMPRGLWMKTAWWPGPSSLFEFQNGTRKIVETLATTDSDALDARNGTAMYDRTCLSQKPSLSSRSTASNSQDSKTGYPKKGIHADDNVISGYFPKQDALRDTAILTIPTFVTLPSSLSPFVKDFLRNATEQGKKKLIIDLSGNPGGSILSGFSLFAEIFPGKEIHLGTRFRSHESANLLGRVLSHMNDSAVLEEAIISGIPFLYQVQVTPDQERGFESWKDLYGPHELLGTNTSSLLAVFNITAISNNGTSPINGYGPIPLDPKKPAFAPDDITIITDGYCASTCITFVTLMKEQGVRSIAFGGRPRKGPMQAMGGVKGAQSMELAALWQYFDSAQNHIARSAETKSPVLSHDEWKRFNETAVPNPNDFSLAVYPGAVNLRSTYARDDDTTPLQFVYEAAECRRFFTVDNYFSQESVWIAAAEAMFGDGKCVEGSTNGKGSLDAARQS